MFFWLSGRARLRESPAPMPLPDKAISGAPPNRGIWLLKRSQVDRSAGLIEFFTIGRRGRKPFVDLDLDTFACAFDDGLGELPVL